MSVSPVDAAIILNIIADIYFRARREGITITPENIRKHISDLEARADANDAVMGIS